MGIKSIRACLIFASLLIVASLAACSKTQSSVTTTPPLATQSANRPSAPRPVNLPPNPATGGPGIIGQPTITLPNNQTGVAGDGTVTVAKYANLFFGTAGQITLINVKPGDNVTSGAILAKLDITGLEAALAQSQANVDQALTNISQNQQNLIADQANLVKAQQNLAAQQDVQNIQNQIDNANIQLQQVQLMLAQATKSGDNGDAQYWWSQATYLSTDTNAASSDLKHKPDGGLIGVLQKQMVDLLADPAQAGAALVSSATAAAQIQQFVLAIQQAQAKIATDQASLVTAQANVVTTQNNVKIAQQQIDEATITAPFNGLIAAVNQNVGDIISAPAQSQHPIIYMIDPSTLELTIGVNELDMPNIKINQKATVSINAFPTAKIDGEVTAIAPVPIVQGGIVDYSVTIAFSVPSNMNVRAGMNASAEIASQ